MLSQVKSPTSVVSVARPSVSRRTSSRTVASTPASSRSPAASVPGRSSARSICAVTPRPSTPRPPATTTAAASCRASWCPRRRWPSTSDPMIEMLATLPVTGAAERWKIFNGLPAPSPLPVTTNAVRSIAARSDSIGRIAYTLTRSKSVRIYQLEVKESKEGEFIRGYIMSCLWTGFLQCFDIVGLVVWPVKIVPEMTYNVSSGTLSLYTTTTCLWNA